MSELKLDNVSYSYKGTNRFAVDNVSCSFEPGKVAVILGPSGSGKSTLLSLLAGLDRPANGSILFNGENLANRDLDSYRRRDIAIIFQAFQLFPLLTAIENVCYPMEINGIPTKTALEEAAKLLEQMGISKEKHRRYPSNLSGGEQQRVAIARALASGAKILLADEPTGNLDLENTENVVNILCELAHGGGYCVVIVTHDASVAKNADVVFNMVDGKLS